MNMKLLLMSLMVLISFDGCVTRTIYVEAQCPHIEVPSLVSGVDVRVTNGCVCDSNVSRVFSLIRELRTTESYCVNTITEYNNGFDKGQDVTTEEWSWSLW